MAYEIRRTRLPRFRQPFFVEEEELFEEKLYRAMPLTIQSTIIMICFSIVTIGIVKSLWPQLIPLPFSVGWDVHGSIFDWCRSSWALLAWGTLATALLKFTSTNPRRYNRQAGTHFIKGALISLWAGISEEIYYRWLYFLAAIFWVQVLNFITFGLVKWLHLHAFGPLADLTSFHQLHGMMFHPLGWFVGAAMIATNSSFRDGHAYQGFLGLINAWFIGMFMFWMMFRYGLPAAIVIHALYDLLIFGVKYIDALIERQRGIV